MVNFKANYGTINPNIRRAHKVVLSACSTYFRALFLDHPARHPIVILKDVCFAELRTLVEFMYRGEVSVETCRLSALLKTAESLKVSCIYQLPINIAFTYTCLQIVVKQFIVIVNLVLTRAEIAAVIIVNLN